MSTKTAIKKARFDTRLPHEQKLLFERAAAIGGYRNLTDFVILSAQEKARQIIRESEEIISSEKDSLVFFNALSETQTPNDALLSAAKNYKNATTK
jgi:uncharacterized protein (DUF1778 family)